MGRVFSIILILLALQSSLFASSYDWGNTFDYSGRNGNSELVLSDAMEVMTMETACAYDDMAHAYGFRPDFHKRELFFDLAGDIITEEFDGTLSILYRNGHRAKAETIWPVMTVLSRMVPVPNKDHVVVQYSVYDADTLQIGFSLFKKEYAKEYIALLKEYFPIVVFEDSTSYKGKSADGKTVSFSLEHSALLLEII